MEVIGQRACPVAFEQGNRSNQNTQMAAVIDEGADHITGAAGVGDDPNAFNSVGDHEHNPSIAVPCGPNDRSCVRGQVQIAFVRQGAGFGVDRKTSLVRAALNLAEERFDRFSGNGQGYGRIIPSQVPAAPD